MSFLKLGVSVNMGVGCRWPSTLAKCRQKTSLAIRAQREALCRVPVFALDIPEVFPLTRWLPAQQHLGKFRYNFNIPSACQC